MESKAHELAQYLLDRVLSTPPTQRFIVGIAGVPASGKSTLSQMVFDRTVELLQTQRADSGAPDAKDIVALVGLDGWHYTRAQLDAFPDPKLAHDRRGAHWTFDGERYVEFVQQLRRPLLYPSDASDPTPDAVAIFPRHRLVIIEGLYPFLDVDPWKEAGVLLDERWWVEIGEDEATTRLVARHVVSGVAKDWEEAEWRARENDTPNGRFIKENMLKPTRIIESVEDPVLVSTLTRP